MAKNFKGKAQKPPLSAVDIVIYTALGITGFLWYLIYFLWLDLLDYRAYADPAVIACNRGNAELCVLPLCLLLSGLFLFAAGIGTGSRQPLLGNRNYKAPAFSHTIEVTPLFSRSFWEALSAEKVKKFRKILISVTAALSLCLLLAFLSFHPRKILTEDLTFITYNSLNEITDTRVPEDAEKLVIGIESSRGGYYLCAEWIYDGASYVLTPGHFDEMTSEESLACLLRLKSFCPAEKYRLYGVDHLDQLIRYQRYTDPEAALVYQLFDVVP